MRRRRIPWIAAAALLFTAILSGCGSKDATSIVKDLDKVMTKMESYQGSGTMTLHTGQQPLNYKVEVWYQKPSFYRIALTNEKRDITQIVLRNDEGVFVLTPSLNKSYRFQSDWPENQGQVYLYQTLVKSIVRDETRKFTTDKNDYVFDVMAGNYQNGSFARQKIWLAKDNFKPRHVEVTDTNNKVMVEVTFDQFEFDKKFDNSAFDMNRNMEQKPNSQTSGTDDTAQDGVQATDGRADGEDPTSGQPSHDASKTPADETTAPPAVQEKPVFTQPDPEALPEGVELLDEKEVKLGEKDGYMLRYGGTYNFTIVEMPSKDRMASRSESKSLDLGFTMGFLTEGDVRTLTWSYRGMEYRLTTADLPDDSMAILAQSMEEASGK
ncbi:outer membrane lipoprotein carrier protein LolA [Cohnella pontilimi]|uniref:Outer membrane lipoprotein carrier protein LolA n=1 Tax=Cohnella pontilimi TaxID=2564100 RepID=A0A4U0FD69_9BACL|nr:outer membrane lipoprotein carrier protein LolA [Cohnella pontilimi]TJY42697.1 outer membrane lipoprotein carrier protein LolA [Cohnella pontilimi]